MGCGCVGSVKTSANSSRRVSHLVATGDISPAYCCWLSCNSGLACCEYSVAAVVELRWPASVKHATSIQIANAFLHNDGVCSMSYICFTVHKAAECLLQLSMVPVSTGAVWPSSVMFSVLHSMVRLAIRSHCRPSING